MISLILVVVFTNIVLHSQTRPKYRPNLSVTYSLQVLMAILGFSNEGTAVTLLCLMAIAILFVYQCTILLRNISEG
jgi:hypothetical protein